MADFNVATINAQLPQTPRGLHHTAYVTRDAVATVDFYTNVMRMPLIATVINSEIGGTQEPYPYLHIFFRMWDGSTIAFFEAPDLPAPAEETDPVYGIFKHLALDVGSKEEVDRWARYLEEKGIDYLIKDHGIIYSLYLHDPSGHRVELTCNVTTEWQEGGEQAANDIRRWAQVKAEANGDSKVLHNWLIENRRYPGKS